MQLQPSIQNLSTRVVSNKCFGRDVAFETGGPGDELVLNLEKLGEETEEAS